MKKGTTKFWDAVASAGPYAAYGHRCAAVDSILTDIARRAVAELLV